MNSLEFRIRNIQSLADVSSAAWNSCASGSNAPIREQGEVKLTSEDNRSPKLSTQGQVDNPFVTHEFLSSLEESRSVGGRTGWEPRYLLAENQEGALVGAAPCYIKSHSRGEYVFDHGWADAFERAGGEYYPKLQIAVHFTPVSGPRLLAASGALQGAVRGALADAGCEITAGNEVAFTPLTVPAEPGLRLLGRRGFLAPTGPQIHLNKAGYTSLEGFLRRVASRKRKTIRRERKEA